MILRTLAIGLATALGLSAASADEPLVKAGTFHLQRPRYASAALTDGNAIYVVGGIDRGELLGSVERFDPRTSESTLVSDRLIPRFYGSAAWVGGKIFVFGGRTNGGTTDYPDPRVEMLDPATGKITLVAPMPKPRDHMAVAVRKGQIYAIGGTLFSKDAFVQTGITEIYDPAKNIWMEGPPMPSPREAHATLVGDFIIVPAGYFANAAQAKVEMFVPAENQWKALPDLRERVSGCSVAFLGEHLFLFGDYGNLSRVLAYSLRDRTSRPISPGFEGVRHTSAVVLGPRIYVVGGTLDQEGTARDLVQVFELRNPPAAQVPKAAK